KNRRPYAGEGMDDVYGRWTKTRLAPQNTHACHDQVINRWFVFQRTMLAVGGDRAMDQTRIEGREPVEGHDRLVARGGGKVFNKHIGSAQQPFIGDRRIIRRRWGVGSIRRATLRWRYDPREVQPDALLTPVPHQITAAARRGIAAVKDPDNTCAVVAEKHGG